MICPLTFSKINPYTNCLMYFGDCLPSVITNILNARVQENPIITPDNTTIVVSPSAANRTLGTVTVLPQKPLYYTVSIVVDGTEIVPVNNIATAVSSDTAVATVVVGGNGVTITGVAAGTSVISVFDANKELLATIYTTVA